MAKKTSFENKCQILGDFYVAYKEDEDYADYFRYNDLGLVLAYAISSGTVESTPKAKTFIKESWGLLLAILELDDEGYEELDDILPVEDDDY